MSENPEHPHSPTEAGDGDKTNKSNKWELLRTRQGEQADVRHKVRLTMYVYRSDINSYYHNL